MAQKVFILNNLQGQNLAGVDLEITNYWGDLADSVKFIAHQSYLYRLSADTGYFAIKVSSIKKPESIDVRWISFDVNDAPQIEASSANARYFVIKKEALDAILTIDPNANSIGVEFGVRIENGILVHSAIIAPGEFAYADGGGGTSPSAGAKLP